MNLSLTSRTPYAPPIEFVERKGTGHPDTICDHLAEELARRLARDYQKYTGVVRHFNVDKAILAAGSVDIGYGGGTHTKPSKLRFVGKATFGYDITQRMIAETDASEVTIRLLSSIGHSATEPQAVHIETAGAPDEAAVLEIAEDCSADWANVTDRLVDGEYELC